MIEINILNNRVLYMYIFELHAREQVEKEYQIHIPSSQVIPNEGNISLEV